MSKDQWTSVDDYLNKTLLGADSVLDSVLQANRAADLPAIDVAPNQGKFLQLLAQIQGARRILEIGTLGGYSTIWLARGLPPDGRLLSLELNPKHAAVAEANVAQAGLAKVVDIQVGPALETLSQLVAEQTESFDLIFIDADKSNMPNYLTLALKLAHPGTVIIGDNVIRNGAVTDAASADANVQGVRQFLEMIAANPRLSATALQTVGAKGWDGFALARVLGE
jgi:predicted O-methyltransferase YrrM